MLYGCCPRTEGFRRDGSIAVSQKSGEGIVSCDHLTSLEIVGLH